MGDRTSHVACESQQGLQAIESPFPKDSDYLCAHDNQRGNKTGIVNPGILPFRQLLGNRPQNLQKCA
eukprot:6162222-Amphidinium_carterae.1